MLGTLQKGRQELAALLSDLTKVSGT